MKSTQETSRLPQSWHAQIQEILNQFHEIRREAAGIFEQSEMPDSTAQLMDVLRSTETAASTILDNAAELNHIAVQSGATAEEKMKIQLCVSRIYEACSFQDISGQRIQKVLKRLALLEGQLQRLSEGSEPLETSKMNPENALLNGPQLSTIAPTQEEIDKLFK